MKKFINFYKSEKPAEKRNALFIAAKKIVSAVSLLLFLSPFAYSQVDITNCYGSCTSGDFTITRAYLSDINGNEITSSACNTAGAIVDAYLSFTFTNNTNSDRNGIFISGTLNGTYIFKCFNGILPKKKSTTFTDVVHKVTWSCGTDLTLKGTFTSWGSSSEQVCDLKCSEATPSKCRTVGDLVIQTPLSNNFSFAGRCETGKTVQTIDFTGSATGGNHSYTYKWDFGDGTANATVLSPSHSYATANTYSVIFTVTDGTGASKSVTKSVSVSTCCVTPTITSNPSAQIKCDGSSASFTVASSGGSPAPTLQWQVSTDGTNFTNLTNVSPYTGVTTTTLSLSSAAVALNGNKYRCVITSGSCTPATSTAALLTVNAIPAAPGVKVDNNCDGSSDLTATNFTGSLLWNTTATSTSIHVSDASATTYTVQQTVAGCTSANGSGTTAPRTASSAPDASMLTPTCTDKTFSVQVNSPVSGTTYTLTQPGNSNAAKSFTYTGSGNVTFTGLTFGDGFSVTGTNTAGCVSSANNCGSTTANRQMETTSTRPIQAITLEEPLTKVTAAPNPFGDRIKFSLQSAVSGQGSLELYDMLGRKLKTVFQGYVQKGQIKMIEYSVPGAQHANLIYLFKVGTERKTGILIGIK